MQYMCIGFICKACLSRILVGLCLLGCHCDSLVKK